MHIRVIRKAQKMPKQLGEITLFSLQEISKELDISIQTLRRYIKDEKLIAQKIGNNYFITEDNLKKFLKS